MKQTLLALLVVGLAACSTPPPPPSSPPKAAEVLPSPNAVYPSPDGWLYATIRHSKKPYTLAIIERESGQVLGVAESSAHLNDSKSEMYGSVRVTYSTDLSTIVVHEDFSDASPNPYYILFQRRPRSAAYQASYLAPPTAHIDTPGEFDFVCPAIQSVTADTICLDYEDGRTRVIRISDLLQSRTPKGAQEWDSEAYKRYDRGA
jgi:hypothetical protein